MPADATLAKFWHIQMIKRNIPVYLAASLTILVGICARLAIGNVYSQALAVDLIGALTDTGLYLGSAIATSSATTLALMLTLLGLTNRSESDFDAIVYKRISSVSILATASLVGSVILLLALVMPIGEFENLPNAWYPLLYNLLFTLVIIVCAFLVTTVAELFLTIRQVLSAVTPGDDI